MTHLSTHWRLAAALLATACAIHLGKSPDKASSAETGSAADCPTLDEPFKVQIVVLTEHEDAPTGSSFHDLMDDGDPITLESDTGVIRRVDGETLLRREVEVHLTNNFVTAGGEPVCGKEEDGEDDLCISFEVADIVFRADISDKTCPELLALGDISEEEYNDLVDSETSLSTAIENAVNACADPKVRAPQAINLYIFDNCSFDTDDVFDCVKEKNSRGRNNTLEGEPVVYAPYVFLDIARLQHTTQAPEEHEFGHAFGLNHTCDPDISTDTADSNIMQSACHGAGSGGARNLGFKEVDYYDISQDPCDTGCTEERDQVETIMNSAKAFVGSWCTDSP